MLVSMRKVAGTWIMAIFSFLLIVSFGIWGVGDIFRGRVSDAVVTVGGVEFPRREVQREFRREMTRLRAALGRDIDADTARRMGLVNRAVDTIVARALYDLDARRLALGVPDAVIASEIRSMAAFKNDAGVFDPNIFRSVLANQGMSEDEFVLAMRGDLVRGQLTDTVSGAAKAPEVLAKPLYQYRNERRSAAYFVVTRDAAGDIAEPDEAALKAYYDAHPDRFTAPEYRRLSYVHVTPDDLAAEIAVPEADIEAEYVDRKAQFTKPERRTLQQILVADSATAERARKLLAEGRAFDAVAAEVANQSGDALTLGTFTHDELKTVIGAAADAVFALPQGGVSAPLQSPLGWHLFRVTAVKPGAVESLDEVRDTLRRDIARRRAIDALYKLANRLDDTLAGGATLAEAASSLGVPLKTIAAVDAKARAPDGTPVTVPATANFLSTAFTTAEGETSLLVEGEDGSFFVVHVDGVTPSAVRPFAEVRDEVRKAWSDEQRRAKAGEVAAAAAKRIGSGEDIAQVAKATGVSLFTSGAIRRDGDGAGAAFSPALIQRLFTLKEGEVATGETAKGTMVLRLDKVFPGDPAADAKGMAKLRKTLRVAMAGDLLAVYRTRLEQRYPVTVDRGAIDAMF